MRGKEKRQMTLHHWYVCFDYFSLFYIQIFACIAVLLTHYVLMLVSTLHYIIIKSPKGGKIVPDECTIDRSPATSITTMEAAVA